LRRSAASEEFSHEMIHSIGKLVNHRCGPAGTRFNGAIIIQGAGESTGLRPTFELGVRGPTADPSVKPLEVVFGSPALDLRVAQPCSNLAFVGRVRPGAVHRRRVSEPR